MKKAQFTNQIINTKTGATKSIYGEVTLKHNGKISVSIYNRNYNSYQENYKTTELAKAIVASNFNHPAITSMESTDDGNKVVELIRKETEQLKSILIEKTIEFAKNSFSDIKNIYESVSKLDWAGKCKYFNIKLSDDCKHFADTYEKNNYYKMVDRMNRYYTIIDNGIDTYIEKCVDNANNHYEQSLMKLVNRINRKSINVDNMKLVSGYVGMNLELTLSDGTNEVNARTIWAAQESELVTPHYRYLIK